MDSQVTKNSENTYKVEDLEAFYFRGSNKALFGCSHKPMFVSQKSHSVLICYPVGHEYQNCHRALRQLSSQLAKRGFYTMRFDYYGSGDSAGRYEDASLSQWRCDIYAAADVCKQRSGSQKLIVIGLRLGASLAMQALSGRGDIEAFVLWSPILKSSKLIEEWSKLQRKHESSLGYKSDNSTLDEVLGFSLSSKIHDELVAMDVSNVRTSVKRVLVLHHEADNEVDKFVSHLTTLGVDTSFNNTDAATVWCKNTMDAIVPFEVLSLITSWV